MPGRVNKITWSYVLFGVTYDEARLPFENEESLLRFRVRVHIGVGLARVRFRRVLLEADLGQM